MLTQGFSLIAQFGVECYGYTLWLILKFSSLQVSSIHLRVSRPNYILFLFDVIPCFPVNNFSSMSGRGSSWVEPVLSPIVSRHTLKESAPSRFSWAEALATIYNSDFSWNKVYYLVLYFGLISQNKTKYRKVTDVEIQINFVATNHYRITSIIYTIYMYIQ